MPEKPCRVLLVDDEKSLRKPLQQYLQRHYHFAIDTAGSRDDAWQRITQTEIPYDVALIDDMLIVDQQDTSGSPQALGIELMRQIKAHSPRTECIIFTGWGMERGIEALRAGAYRYLAKPFNNEELGMLITAAAEHGRLKGIAHEKQTLERLLKTSMVLQSRRSLSEILDTILQGVKAIAFDRVRLYLLSKDGRTMVGRAQIGMDEDFVGLELPVAEDFYVQALMEDPRPHLFKRHPGRPLPHEQQLAKEAVSQWACVPLLYQGEVTGKLSADNKFSQRPILEPVLDSMALFASQAAAAIENAHLREEEQKAAAEAKRRARNLAAVQEISRTISSVLALDEIMETICRAAVELFGADHSGLVLFDAGNEWGRVAAECPDLGTVGTRIPVQGIPAEEQLIGAREPLVFPDAANEESLGPVRDILARFNIRSLLILPVVSKKQVWGSLSVDFIDDYHDFIGEEVALCQTFAAQVAVAVENARTHERAKKYAQKLEALYEIGTKMTSDLSLESILQSITEHITHLVGARKSLFLLVDQKRKRLLKKTGYGYPSEHLQAMTFAEVEAGVSGWVLRERKPVLIADAQSDPRNTGVAREKAAQFGTMPLIVVPLLVKGEAIGTLTAANTADDPRFTEEELSLAAMLANQVAIAVENARLLQKTKSGLAYLQAISRAGRVLISTLDPAQILPVIVEQAREAVGAWRVSVILIDNGRPYELAAVGYEEAPDVSTIIRPQGISRHVVKSGKPCFIEDTTAGPVDINPDMIKEKVGAAACLPFTLRRKTLGVMWVQYHQPHAFSETEKEALRIYSEKATIAYDNARRMQELEHMRQAAAALARATRLPAVLEQIVQSARKVLQANSAALLSYDAVREKFVLQDAVVDGIPNAIWQRFLKDTPRRGQTIFTIIKRGWVAVEDVSQEEQYAFLGKGTRKLLKKIKARSFQGIALTVGKEVLGVLYVNYDHSRSFRKEERRTAETFANHAALALKKSKLLDQVDKARNTAHVVAKVTALANPDDTLRSVAKGMVAVVNCDTVTVYVHDQRENRLIHVPMMEGFSYPERANRFPELEEDSLVFEMLQREEMYVAEEVVSDMLFKNEPFIKERGIASCVAIPLRVGAETEGVMFVNYRHSHRFTEDELANIELFALQAAVAFQNARLFEVTRRHADLLKTAAQVAREATATLHINELLHKSVKLIAELFNFYHVGVFLLDESGRYAVLRATYPKKERGMLKPGHRLSVGKEGIIGHVTAAGRYHLAPDVTMDPYHLPNPLLPLTKSEMVFPLNSHGRVIGAFDLQSKETIRLTDEDIATLETMADQLANAIKNARLFQQVSRRLEETDALQQVAVALTGASELNDVLMLVMQEAMKLTGTDEGSILLWDAQREQFTKTLRIERNGSPENYRSAARTEGGLAREIIEKQELVVIEDAQQIPGFNPAFLDKGYRATLGAPLLSPQESAIGVLYVRSKEPRRFTGRQIGLMKALASQAAVAIDRAHRYEELKEIKGYIGSNTAVDWIKMVSTAWGHNLRREVGTALAHVALVRGMLAKPLPAKVAEELRQLENVIGQIKEIPITAPLSYEDAIDSVPINDVVETYLQRQWRHDRYKGVTLCFDLQPDLDNIATVWASREWLRRGIEIVVDNAVWAMSKANVPQKRMTVVTRLQDNNNIKITIADTGPGITNDVMERLFKEPIPKSEESRGSGIGLMLAQSIFQTYRGDIGVEATGSNGTVIEIVLPAESGGHIL